MDIPSNRVNTGRNESVHTPLILGSRLGNNQTNQSHTKQDNTITDIDVTILMGNDPQGSVEQVTNHTRTAHRNRSTAGNTKFQTPLPAGNATGAALVKYHEQYAHTGSFDPLTIIGR